MHVRSIANQQCPKKGGNFCYMNLQKPAKPGIPSSYRASLTLNVDKKFWIPNNTGPIPAWIVVSYSITHEVTSQ